MSDTTSSLLAFWGNGERKGENPRNFLNSVERALLARPVTTTEAQKVRLFELWLKSGSAAELWFTELDGDEKDTWAHLTTAFNTRWPAHVRSAHTMEEMHTLLAGTLLDAATLDSRAKVGGVEEYTHVIWADKIEQLARSLKDDGGLLIPAIRKTMLCAMRALVGAEHTSWSLFCKAVRNMSMTSLRKRLEVEHEQDAVQAELAHLRARPPQAPPISA